MSDLATIPDLLGTSPADLIDGVTDRPVATTHDARQRAERVRAGLDSYTRMRQDIADAYACRDWLALGYPTWFAYLDGEYGPELRRLSRDERREAVRDLRTQGMTTREIAKATGVDQSTIVRDAQVMQGASPATVTGKDGKTYPGSRPTPQDHPPRAGEADARLDAAAPTAACEAPGVAGHTPGAGDSSPTPPAATPVARLPQSQPEGSGPTPPEVGQSSGDSRPTSGPDLERPRPPAWDPAERAAHEADVRRRQDIDAAHRQAKTLVPDVTSHILTVLAGYRLGEKRLVTKDMITELRRAVDLLEKEIDGEN